MTPEQEAIARRLRVQCERFGWPTGMRVGVGANHTPALVVAPETMKGRGPGIAWVCDYDEADEDRLIVTTWPGRDLLPVPHDPATIGCFAAMARKATGRRLYAVPTIDGDAWQVCEPASFGENEPAETAPDGSFGHATEIEAWLAVLEATP